MIICFQKYMVARWNLQKSMVFETFRKFTWNSRSKIPKPYCATTRHMQLFYTKIRSIKSKL